MLPIRQIIIPSGLNQHGVQELSVSDRAFGANPSHFLVAPPIMFFIGIYDKHGVKIFSGDIVRMTEITRDYMGQDEEDAQSVTMTGVIEFESGCFWFQAPGRSENCWFHHNSSDIEVIGNVFQNPELSPFVTSPQRGRG